MTKMTKAERKAEKEKIKKMSFKEKREYYKSKRIGWRKAWYIIKWILAGFAAFVVTCLIIMIVQLNTESKTITKAVHKAEAKATTTTKQPQNTAKGTEMVILVEKKDKGVWQNYKSFTNMKDGKQVHTLADEVTEPGTYRTTFFLFDNGKPTQTIKGDTFNQ